MVVASQNYIAEIEKVHFLWEIAEQTLNAGALSSAIRVVAIATKGCKAYNAEVSNNFVSSSATVCIFCTLE